MNNANITANGKLTTMAIRANSTVPTCSALTSNSLTNSHGAPESPKRSLTPMAPVIASTDMPMVVAVPWKIRSEAGLPGDSLRGTREVRRDCGGAPLATVIQTARLRSPPCAGRAGC